MIEVAFGTLWGGHVVVGAILLLSSWTSPTLLSMLNLILQPVWCFVNKGRKLKKKKRYLAAWPLSLLATNLRVKEEKKTEFHDWMSQNQNHGQSTYHSWPTKTSLDLVNFQNLGLKAVY